MKIFKILLLSALMLSGVTSAAAESPKREMRSVWVAGMGIDWPKSHATSSTGILAQQKQLTDMLDIYKSMNINGICLHVRPRADAYYKSSYEPWSADLTGTRGRDPGWDPLAFAIEECHKRGMEIYAWINPYRVNANGVTYTTDQDKEWAAKGWLIKSGKWTSFNPGLKEARDHCLNVIKEIYTNYMVDGLLFDDYFYPGDQVSKDSSAPDWQTYKDSGTTLSIGDWRRKNVNDFVRDLYNDIQKVRPDMRFGIGPAGISKGSAASHGLPVVGVSSGDWMYDGIYCDPLAWMADKTIDFIAPQIYWQRSHSTAAFTPLCEWWQMAAEHFGIHNYVSVASYKVNTGSFGGPQEISAQIDLTRKYATDNAPGIIYYNATSINNDSNGTGKYVAANNYTSPALVPVVTWKEHTVYPAPAALTLTDGTLTWTAAKASSAKTIIRYTVYAIPTGLTLTDVLGDDGIDSRYLAGITYTPSFTLSEAQADDHWYAVCVYDGYGYESEPAVTGMATEPSEAVTLVSPADGEKVDWETRFSWTAVKDGSYYLEISEKADFSTLKFNIRAGAATSATVSLRSLPDNTFLWWRVRSTQPGRLAARSEARSIRTGERGLGDYEEGYVIKYDPATYPTRGDITIENLWMRAAKSPFSNLTFIQDGMMKRGMAAAKDYVYLSRRNEGSAYADMFLEEYSALTGEHIRDIQLSDNGHTSFYPCNDVIKDSKGNICISSLSLNLSTTPVLVHSVDLADGTLTEVASLSYTGGGRVDHVGLYGDVTSGDFYVFAAIAGQPTVLRWHVSGGRTGSPTAVTIGAFYPASSGHFSTAPKVFPVSENLFYADGNATAWTLYDFRTPSAMKASFAQAAELAPSLNTDNGGAHFVLNGRDYCVYNVDPSSAGARFNIVSMKGSETFAGMERLWCVPEGDLGTVVSSTCSAPADAFVNGDGTANVYVYSAGNGISAYRLRDNSAGVADITAADATFTVRLSGRTALTDGICRHIRVYTVTGALVAEARETDRVTMPAEGMFIIATDRGTRAVAVR